MSAESLATARHRTDALDEALGRYAMEASDSDIMLGATADMAPRWSSMLAELAASDKGGLPGLQHRAA